VFRSDCDKIPLLKVILDEARLKYNCMNGGTIQAAIRRMRWPGVASVIASVVFVVKGPTQIPAELDGRQVAGINSFLFESTQEFEPVRLKANEGVSFQGACVLAIRQITDTVLKRLSNLFSQIYSEVGRRSMAPEKLLRALLLQVLYTVRSERMLIS
jgi:hypothetical protein